MKKYIISFILIFVFSIGVSQVQAVTADSLESSKLQSDILNLQPKSTSSTGSVVTKATNTSPACPVVVSQYTATRTHHWTDNELDSSKHPEIKRYKIQWFSGSWSDWYYPGVNDVDTKETFRKVWRYFDDHNYQVETCDGLFTPIGSSTLISKTPSLDSLKITSDGCTATSKFSPTTGLLCSTVNTTPVVQAVAPTISFTGLKLTRNLAYGLMNDVEVKNLQNFLIEKGYLETGLSSGNYLGKTVSALKAFQKANNIQGDGRSVGPLTRNALVAPKIVGTNTIVASRCNLTDIPNPSLNVAYPNGGEVFWAGQDITITWNTKCYSPVTPLIGFDLATCINNNCSNTFLLSRNPLTNDGSETVTIPANTPTASNYKIRIFSYDSINNNPAYYKMDYSDNLFTIKSLNAQQASTPEPKCFPGSSRIPCVVTPPQCSGGNPLITVLSPNGGEIFNAGQEIKVTWESCNMLPTDLVNIYIQHHYPAGGGLGGANYGALLYTSSGAYVFANNGSENVILPSQYSLRPFGEYFKILVVKHPYSSQNSTLYDLSDNLFTINQ